MHLRLVASDGVLLDADEAPTCAPAPDFSALSGRAKDLLMILGTVATSDEFSIPLTRLCAKKGWNIERTRKALNELRDSRCLILVSDSRGPNPRVWRLHPYFMPPGEKQRYKDRWG